MKTKQENRDRIAKNVRNWRAKKSQEGYVRLELYLSPDMISGIFRQIGPDGSNYGLPGAVLKLLEAKTD